MVNLYLQIEHLENELNKTPDYTEEKYIIEDNLRYLKELQKEEDKKQNKPIIKDLFEFETNKENCFFDLSYSDLDFYFKQNGREETLKYLEQIQKTKIINISGNEKGFIYPFKDGSSLALEDLNGLNDVLKFGITNRYRKIQKNKEDINDANDYIRSRNIILNNLDLKNKDNKTKKDYYLKQIGLKLLKITTLKEQNKRLMAKNKEAKKYFKDIAIRFYKV